MDINAQDSFDPLDKLLTSDRDLLETIINENIQPELAFRNYLETLKEHPHFGDFPQDLEWFNVSKALSFLKELKGKLVLLDFFTYCCINCMHILPDLKLLEEKYTVKDGLVIVGVHSPKFDNEQNSNNLLSAVQRYNITHPVVNDKSNFMWNKCNVSCWPTLLLFDPSGNPILMLMGEGHGEKLKIYLKVALEFYKEDLSSHELPIQPARHLLPDLKGPLLFPGKVATFIEGDLEILAISDTGNNRILIQQNGIITNIIGTHFGFKDGDFSKACFKQPQGVAFLNRHILFVADTDNHAIREINLENQSVKTIAGNGQQCDDKTGGQIGMKQGISSPWDLTVYNDKLILIAMAGNHQIWGIFLKDTVWWKNKEYKTGSVVSLAGSGNEENRNNNYPNRASFAQPSGLALMGNELFIADSESSTIRKLSLVDGKVSGVVGGDVDPMNLFAFGDKDGIGRNGKLQHALGLMFHESTLYVTDTYNHKIKTIDVATNELKSLTRELNLNEPGGLCAGLNKIYIADTNHHSIKILNKNNELENLNLNFKMNVKDKSKLQVLTAPAVEINSQGGKVILTINLKFMPELHLTEDVDHTWRVDLPNANWSCTPISGDVNKMDMVVSAPGASSDANYVDVIIKIMTCTDDACYPQSFIARLPVNYKANGKSSITSNIIIAVDPKNTIIL